MALASTRRSPTVAARLTARVRARVPLSGLSRRARAAPMLPNVAAAPAESPMARARDRARRRARWRSRSEDHAWRTALHRRDADCPPSPWPTVERRSTRRTTLSDEPEMSRAKRSRRPRGDSLRDGDSVAPRRSGSVNGACKEVGNRIARRRRVALHFHDQRGVGQPRGNERQRVTAGRRRHEHRGDERRSRDDHGDRLARGPPIRKSIRSDDVQRSTPVRASTFQRYGCDCVSVIESGSVRMVSFRSDS